MHKEKIWTTKDGRQIPYEELEDDHLLNILHWIERAAMKGYVSVVWNAVGFVGDGVDGDVWAEEYEYRGVKALEHFDYFELAKEALKRGILREEDLIISVAPYLITHEELVAIFLKDHPREYMMSVVRNRIYEKYWKKNTTVKLSLK